MLNMPEMTIRRKCFGAVELRHRSSEVVPPVGGVVRNGVKHCKVMTYVATPLPEFLLIHRCIKPKSYPLEGCGVSVPDHARGVTCGYYRDCSAVLWLSLDPHRRYSHCSRRTSGGWYGEVSPLWVRGLPGVETPTPGIMSAGGRKEFY